MKLLFLARHFTYFRNFESVLRLLAERGHRLHLAAEREESLGGRQMVEELARRYPAITVGWVPDRSDERWAALAAKIRLSFDYLRYLEPTYERAPRLRGRARERVPRLVRWLVAAPGMSSRAGRKLFATTLRALERAVPRDPEIEQFLAEQWPDLVLFTPLIGVVASPQFDYLRSARALGLRTALCVWSWDHLSSKALIRDVPDRIFVWNDTQKAEAVDMHRIPAHRIVVTGAQCFDQWFDRAPSRSRAEFCARVGLPADRPFVLYVCSALFAGSPPESEFVVRWIRAIRASPDPRLRETAILVRPHPSRTREWALVDRLSLQNVVVWGRNPIDAESKADYFDSLYYSSAVVGLNTSAFLEAAIVGRPVYTLLLPELWENQEGTIHFHYLLNVAGGLPCVSRSLEEHLLQLAEAVSGATVADHRRFVEDFLRPHGLSTPATRVFVDEVERLLESPAAPATGDVATSSSLRLVLRLLAVLTSRGVGRQLIMDEREVEGARRLQVATRLKMEHRTEQLGRKEASRRERDFRRVERTRLKRRKMAHWRREKLKNLIKQKLGIA